MVGVSDQAGLRAELEGRQFDATTEERGVIFEVDPSILLSERTDGHRITCRLV